MAFVLPSTVISAVFSRGSEVSGPCFFGPGGESGVLDFWKTEDPEFVTLMGGAESLAHTLPLCFHEDGVPRWHGETATFFSWSTPLTVEGSWVSRNCIVGLGSSTITKATRSAILDIISWDLHSLRSGFFPTHDHKGHPFSIDCPEGRRAAKPIAKLATGTMWTACFCSWKGDQEASAAAHDALFFDQRHFPVSFSQHVRTSLTNKLDIWKFLAPSNPPATGQPTHPFYTFFSIANLSFYQHVCMLHWYYKCFHSDFSFH